MDLIIHSEFFSYNSDCFCIPAREILIFHYSYFVLKTVTFWQLEPIAKARQKCWHASKIICFFSGSLGWRVCGCVLVVVDCCACGQQIACLQNANYLQFANDCNFAIIYKLQIVCILQTSNLLSTSTAINNHNNTTANSPTQRTGKKK